MAMMNPYLVKLVVDHLVQLIVVRLDVDVELFVLNCCDPICCCTLETPTGDVAPPELKTRCKMPAVQKRFLVEHAVDVINVFCCWN